MAVFPYLLLTASTSAKSSRFCEAFSVSTAFSPPRRSSPASSSAAAEVSAPLLSTKSSSSETSQSSCLTIKYRTAQANDLAAIARLLEESFESNNDDGHDDDDDNDNEEEGIASGVTVEASPSPDRSEGSPPSVATGMGDTTTMTGLMSSIVVGNDEKSQQKQRLRPPLEGNDYETQLRRRMQEMARQKSDERSESTNVVTAAHALIVAIAVNDTSGSSQAASPSMGLTESTDRIVGFMEIGTMPSPVAPTVQQGWKGVALPRPEMPFLANVAVSKDFRRQKVGSTLVQLAIKIAKKWTTSKDETPVNVIPPFLFLSVERGNTNAISFYQSLGFTPMPLDRSTGQSHPQDDKPKKVYFKTML